MESDDENENSTAIKVNKSAYTYFITQNHENAKEALLKDGKEASTGAVMSYLGQRWKALSPEDKAPYEELAFKDKQRFEEESRIRDEEALRQQEERRKANQITETSTRMRGTTLANSDASTFRSEHKRKREVSEKEKEKSEAKKQARRDEENAIAQQLDVVKEEKARQAEARLKYLLSQSDIFAHFGKKGTSLAEYKDAGESGGRSHHKIATAEDLDEDEKAMAKEIGDDDNDEGDADEPHHTILLKQPRLITGGDLRHYQLDGLNWMIRLQENGINGILADEMGLGKTLQSISILAYMLEFKKVSGPHLIMVPKSTLSNWCNEFKRFCPKFRILRFHGSKDERAEIIQHQLKPAQTSDSSRDWDVCVTTYEVVNLEKSALTKIAWRYLIIDEAHRLKNEASQFSQTVRLLTTQHRLLLTGTPLQNNLHELWALLNFLLPDVFASSEQFDEWFNLDISDAEAKQRMIGQLHKLLRPFMLRRLKADVEKSLPPKTETILFTGMSALQKSLYKQILLRDIDTINTAAAGGNNSQQSRTAILNIVMQLRKCCNHPYLFPNQEDRTLDPLGEHLIQNCGKMVLFDKLLGKMKIRGHRVLVFSQMTRMLDILEDYLISQGYKYCRIDGNTTYEEREDRIADFNREGSDKFVFILSTRAGGLGINLQTADTVILYDSDWNPQADLQAQDRAHRIGQKKPVQVFRLVTDDSVEVKVVERAQQKLKLDAMVVQQGRLQEKEKKMSKQDLLDTLRFGADKIFRSKESAITDADIDLILEEGKRRTEEMNEKLQVAEKGDMYDFRLDGGMSTQIFEGKDYSDRSLREQELNNLISSNYLFLDPGKRERKAVVNYSETSTRQVANKEDGGENKIKLPRHLRLNKMEDWQFYNKTRLNELQAEEIRLFDSLIERGEVPSSGSLGKLVLLPPELHEEKQRLLEEGFGDWTKVHFNNFVRASAKHGRQEYEKIAKDVGRPIEETKRYSETFWLRGQKEFSAQEWEKAIKQIEKGEKRLEEISRLTEATARLIAMFDDPWEELTFRNVGNVNRIFTAVEDRFLLCLTHLHGYGSWDQVRNSIRRCERFRFDFYLQSCSAETLGKRCELLMRAAERELLEIERKRQSSNDPTSSSSSSAQAKPMTQSEIVNQKFLEITKKINDETKRLAAVRSQLQKIKAGGPLTEKSTSEKKAKSEKSDKKSNKEEAENTTEANEEGNEGGAAGEEGEKGEKKKGTGQRGAAFFPVPESLYPSLCKMLVASGADGINKVVDKFIERFPNYSKRQVEIKINELALKEKRNDDSVKVWHIKSEFEFYLHLEEKAPPASALAAPPSKKPGPKGKKAATASTAADATKEEGGDEDAPAEKDVEEEKEPPSSAKKSAAAAAPKSAKKSPAPKKEKGDGADAAAPPAKTPAKRKAADANIDTTESSLSHKHGDGESDLPSPNPSSSAMKEPRKPKTAFGIFVKSKRGEAEAKLGAESTNESLKNLLCAWWEECDPTTRRHFEKKEQEDHDRYEKELAAWTAQKGSSASSAKKAKAN